MTTYALFCTPCHGHVNPTLAVAQELLARSEHVIYNLPDEFRAAVEATGATFRLYEPAHPPRSGLLTSTPEKKADMAQAAGWMMQTMMQESISNPSYEANAQTLVVPPGHRQALAERFAAFNEELARV